MRKSINRELKSYCPDFGPLKEALSKIGARPIEEKDQVDYFYNLPASRRTHRLKLRSENGPLHMIYYYDSRKRGTREVQFQIFNVSDSSIKEIFDNVLGVKKTVRKHREVWRKDNAIFHFDEVDDVGKIFEIEIEDNPDTLSNLIYYKELLKPWLGKEIIGSNEDLVKPI